MESTSSSVTFLLMTSRRRWVPASAAKVRPLFLMRETFSINSFEKLSTRRLGSDRLTRCCGVQASRSSSSGSISR